MNPLLIFPILGVILLATSPTFAEPYSPSCQSAIEKLSKSQKGLMPFQRTMELAKARERGAYGELAFCMAGGVFTLNQAVRCSEAKWEAPRRTKEFVQAEDRYTQERKAFLVLFERAKKVCISEP